MGRNNLRCTRCGATSSLKPVCFQVAHSDPDPDINTALLVTVERGKVSTSTGGRTNDFACIEYSCSSCSNTQLLHLHGSTVEWVSPHISISESES